MVVLGVGLEVYMGLDVLEVWVLKAGVVMTMG